MGQVGKASKISLVNRIESSSSIRWPHPQAQICHTFPACLSLSVLPLPPHICSQTFVCRGWWGRTEESGGLGICRRSSPRTLPRTTVSLEQSVFRGAVRGLGEEKSLHFFFKKSCFLTYACIHTPSPGTYGYTKLTPEMGVVSGWSISKARFPSGKSRGSLPHLWDTPGAIPSLGWGGLQPVIEILECACVKSESITSPNYPGFSAPSIR